VPPPFVLLQRELVQEPSVFGSDLKLEPPLPQRLKLYHFSTILPTS
jgi:hypothetical protein